MFIQSGTKYKSLDPIQPSIELPDFVVLSGLNGGGKTQLLAGVNENVISITDHGKPVQPVRFVNHNTLSPNNSAAAPRERLRPHIDSLIKTKRDFKLPQIQTRPTATRRPGANPKGTVDQSTFVRMLKKIAENAGKNVEDLSEEDIYCYYPLDDNRAPNDIFQQNFSALFKQYQVRKYENDVDQFRNQKYGSIVSLTDQEFLKVYGEPPWILVNKIIADADLDYHTNFPEDRREDLPFEFRLINNLNGANVNFSDLSGGEKVIMSLALSLYNSEFDIVFPKALLMDEPDAHLHPSMTKKFLDVIQNIFVNEKGVKVIITTHSPSTVALAPERSLYLMNKTPPRITKTTKDKALRILTSGVPTLSINHENRRQVFVESKHDVTFYEKVYEKLIAKLVPDISINFISSGVQGEGSCAQVRDVVNTLTRFGNRSIYGIIDWDTTNSGNDFVKVPGKGNRYSLENYIFDPILLAAFLLRERFIDRKRLGLAEADRYTDFSDFGAEKLQGIADFIVSQVQLKVDDAIDYDLQVVDYVGGQQITLPKWFLRIPGHKLEEFIRELFPQLKRFQHEGELKREVVNKVVDEIPDFISMDILSLLREIQNFD